MPSDVETLVRCKLHSVKLYLSAQTKAYVMCKHKWFKPVESLNSMYTFYLSLLWGSIKAHKHFLSSARKCPTEWQLGIFIVANKRYWLIDILQNYTFGSYLYIHVYVEFINPTGLYYIMFSFSFRCLLLNY